MEEKLYLAMLHKIWITQKKLHIIFKDNSDYKFFYENISSSILKEFSFSDKQIEFILKSKNENNLAKLLKTLEKRSVSIVTINDDTYPKYLKEIPNVPYLFYLRWKIDNSPKISVVWSRKITSYWEKSINKIVWDISNFFTIVSGGAAWCDTSAHQICLDKNKKTISVIWTGIDIDYPVFNKTLYDKIVETWWWVISIFPVWEVWNPYNFPIRNEVVAGLSTWVLVVEAKSKSGTLITSNLALDLWKDLFSIPWDIHKSSSDWCNMLIKKWMAKLVSESKDILEEYNIVNSNNNHNHNHNNKIDIVFSDEIEKNIYDILLLENLTIDELIHKTWVDISTISFKLSMMEVNNYIKKWFWWKYEVF